MEIEGYSPCVTTWQIQAVQLQTIEAQCTLILQVSGNLEGSCGWALSYGSLFPALNQLRAVLSFLRVGGGVSATECPVGV
jgi:hypothetical protein